MHWDSRLSSSSSSSSEKEKPKTICDKCDMGVYWLPRPVKQIPFKVVYFFYACFYCPPFPFHIDSVSDPAFPHSRLSVLSVFVLHKTFLSILLTHKTDGFHQQGNPMPRVWIKITNETVFFSTRDEKAKSPRNFANIALSPPIPASHKLQQFSQGGPTYHHEKNVIKISFCFRKSFVGHVF